VVKFEDDFVDKVVKYRNIHLNVKFEIDPNYNDANDVEVSPN